MTIVKQTLEVLKKEGLMDKTALQQFKQFQNSQSGNVLDFCIDQNIASTNQVVSILRNSYKMSVIDLSQCELDKNTSKILPASVCFEHTVIPIFLEGDNLYVAMSNPDDHELIAYIEKSTGKKVFAYLAQQKAIKQNLQLVFNHSLDDSREYIQDLIERAKKLTHTPETMAQQVPIISLINHLILFALRSSASDMHIEPRDEQVVIRLRVDGILHEIFELPKELHSALVARIKIMSRLRIDEHQKPQDGRFSFSETDYKIAVRVSIVPTLYGQKVALRFLDTKNDQLSLDSLGLNEFNIIKTRNVLKNSNGLILVTGPTGSGKTTTLYALLKALSKKKVNISTIEDPIEYHFKDANQIQVNNQVDLTFANGLRSILRQDPDIIMVGEIRDKETAAIAINAALTGHLVLSSLHTNSAAAAIPRLLDMGIEPYLVASTLRMVIGQRLARIICPVCKEKYMVNELPEIFNDLSKTPLEVARGKGCDKCLKTGYQGRSAVFEVLNIDEQIHELIIKRQHATAIQDIAKQKGMKTLIEDGFDKIISQQSTIEEITRIIN